MSTRSWIAIAARSHGRTPRNAKGCSGGGSGSISTSPLSLGAPEAQPRREEELLPGVRPDGVAEAGLVAGGCSSR